MLTFEAKIARGLLSWSIHIWAKDLFIKISARTVVKLLQFLYEFLWISLYLPVKQIWWKSAKQFAWQNFLCMLTNFFTILSTKANVAFAGSSILAFSIFRAAVSICTNCAAFKCCCLRNTKNINSKGQLYPNRSTMVEIASICFKSCCLAKFLMYAYFWGKNCPGAT